MHTVVGCTGAVSSGVQLNVPCDDVTLPFPVTTSWTSAGGGAG